MRWWRRKEPERSEEPEQNVCDHTRSNGFAKIEVRRSGPYVSLVIFSGDVRGEENEWVRTLHYDVAGAVTLTEHILEAIEEAQRPGSHLRVVK